MKNDYIFHETVLMIVFWENSLNLTIKIGCKISFRENTISVPLIEL